MGYFCKKRKGGIFKSCESALGLQFFIPAKHILISVGVEQDSSVCAQASNTLTLQ